MPGSHGGAVAISGYLYQVLAATGLQVSGKAFNNDPSRDPILFVHEAFDEDVVVRDGDSRDISLIQIKYSKNGSSSQIAPGELREIVDRLVVAAKEADKNNFVVGSCLLVSNRELGPGALNLLDNPALGKDDPAPKRTGKGETGAKGKAQKIVWTKAHTQILGSIIDLHLTEQQVETELRTFADSLGVLDTEFESGVEGLISKVFKGIAALSNHAVSRSVLVKIFAGDEEAVSLEKGEQKENQDKELKIIAARDRAPGEHVQRDQTEPLISPPPDKRVFVFYGKGGTGKTASLYELARQQVGTPGGPFLRAMAAIDSPANWSNSCADQWRKVGYQLATNLGRALKRLQVANETLKPPILMLALDGIDDEMPAATQEELKTLINLLLEADGTPKEANFRLFVTCRTLEDIRKYLPHEVSGFDRELPVGCQPVVFENFTKQEFAEIVEREAKKYAPMLLPPNVGLGASGTFSLNAVADMATSVVVTKFDFLRDPLIWRSFVQLTSDEKDSLLAETSIGEIALGKGIFERFAEKASRRAKWTTVRLRRIMKKVAEEVESVPRPWSRQLWAEKGASANILAKGQCEDIFDEVLSGGLIDGGDEDWQWRHKVISSFLKS